MHLARHYRTGTPKARSKSFALHQLRVCIRAEQDGSKSCMPLSFAANISPLELLAFANHKPIGPRRAPVHVAEHLASLGDQVAVSFSGTLWSALATAVVAQPTDLLNLTGLHLHATLIMANPIVKCHYPGLISFPKHFFFLLLLALTIFSPDETGISKSVFC